MQALTMTDSKVWNEGIDQWPTLTGRQKPHHLAVTEGDLKRGRSAILLGKRAGIKTMPWQAGVLLGLLAVTPAGTWVHSTCILIVPRQNGKSLIMCLVILYKLFVRGEKIIYTSHEWKSAEEIALRLWGIIESRPWLHKHVKKHNHSQGQAIVFLKTGAKVYFRTRSAAAGRGVDEVDTLIFDEGFDVTDAEIAALNPTQSAAKDPQVIYASSAVDKEEHRNGLVLSALRADALRTDRDPSTFLAEWMAPDEMDRDSPETWRYANPSFGVIHSESKIRNLQRNMLTPAGRKKFDVEALGRGDWHITDALVEDDITVIDLDHWASLATATPRITEAQRNCLAVDASNDVTNRTWSIAAAVATETGIHGQLGFHGTATTAKLVDYIVQAVEAADPVAVVIDPRSAASVLIDPLTKAGIEPQLMTAARVAAGTQELLQRVDDGTLSHDADPRMTEALAVARLREIGDGGIAWARRKSGGDICQLVAMTNAVYGLTAFDVHENPPETVGFEDTTLTAFTDAELHW